MLMQTKIMFCANCGRPVATERITLEPMKWEVDKCYECGHKTYRKNGKPQDHETAHKEIQALRQTWGV